MKIREIIFDFRKTIFFKDFSALWLTIDLFLK